MRNVAGLYVAVILVCGCTLLMPPEAKQEWAEITASLDTIEAEIEAVAVKVENKEMTVADGIEAAGALRAEWLALQEKRKALEAKGVKWYHVAIGLLGWASGKGWLTSLVLNRVVKGVEKSGSGEVKQAIATESGKGILGRVLSAWLASRVQRMT